jgi:hypothetical protein
VRRCAGGMNAGNVCTAAAGCPGGSCAAAATCTVGDGLACNSGNDGYCRPATCTVDGDCTGGATCDNVCPNGICTPLCGEIGQCSGGDKNGFNCAVDVDCPGGGTCVPGDPFEGACVIGERFHCAGPGNEFRTCLPPEVGSKTSCEYGVDGVPGTGDDYVGAGDCIKDVQNCFVNDGAAEGGDTGNGQGDPTNTLSVATYCIPASESSSVNSTAGLPGPGRIRQRATVVPNFTQLPLP